jgi:nicotinamide-nucleotide amidase
MSEQPEDTDQQLVDRIAERAEDTGTTVALAESLTAGRVSALLGQGSGASEWYRGCVVAYAPEVKFEVLGVEPGPVVTEACARQMAEGVRRRLGASVAVALTGVGGPDPDEGEPPGTVFLAVAGEGGTTCHLRRFSGEPPEVVAATTTAALRLLADALEPGAGMAAGRAGTGRP